MESSTQIFGRSIRRTLKATLLASVVIGISGCLKQFILLSYLIGGPPSIEPEFDRQTGTQLTEFGVKVAVVCYAEDRLKWDFDKIDHQIAAAVTLQLRSHKIDVIEPDRVRAWLNENPDWDRPQEIGASLTAADSTKPTHIIYIVLIDYSLYEPDSHNLYRGRAEATVSVIKMDEEDPGEGEKIYTDEIKSQYPIHAPESTASVPFSDFKGRYMARLSEEIGRLFYERYAGDDIPDGAM